MSDPSAPTPEDLLLTMKTREERYRLGQFFTPGVIADFMAEAALSHGAKTVLDPAVGGGVLLRAVGDTARRFGIDIDADSVAATRDYFGHGDEQVEVAVGDFLDAANWPLSVETFDAIIANPPYIRHHNLADGHKKLAHHYAALLNTRVSSLSGSYAYFFFEALLRLAPGGRLVFITPTEFLDARYGAAVKQAILDNCELDEILVLRQDDLAFDGVLTTSAITIATRSEKPTGNIRLTEATLTSSGVQRGASVSLSRGLLAPTMPWTRLLPTRAARLLPLVRARTARLGQYARFRRGIATGDNDFFCLTEKKARDWGIEPEFLVPVVIGSKDLPESGPLTPEHWAAAAASGGRCWLLWCHQRKSSLTGTNVLRYIEEGERLGIPTRFNCRSRSPWYGAEVVPPPDFFVTYMARDRARFVRNLAGARCMTSLLNVWARPPVTAEQLEPVLHDPTNAILLREFGRTYGGGLGKIEPGDLAGLPVLPVREFDPGDLQLALRPAKG